MKYKSQSGQVTAEMAIGALLLSLVVLGMIYVGGYGISGVKCLLAARRTAEINAANGAGGQGQNITAWSYGQISMERSDATETYSVPFTVLDRAAGGADSSGAVAADILSPVRSVSTPNNFYNSMSSDMSQLFITAANLAEGVGSYSSDAVYTLDANKMTSSKINRTQFDNIFADFSGMKTSVDPVNIEANHVFMPVPATLQTK